jgi:hypothetical protein
LVDGFEEIAGIAGFDAEMTVGKALLELAEDGGEQVLADGDGGSDAEAAVAPSPEFLKAFACGAEVGEHAFRVFEEMFPGLGQGHLPAHPVQKTTADVAFERLDGVADGGLGEEEFASGLRETAVAGEDCECLKLLTVDGTFHP